MDWNPASFGVIAIHAGAQVEPQLEDFLVSAALHCIVSLPAAIQPPATMATEDPVVLLAQAALLSLRSDAASPACAALGRALFPRAAFLRCGQGLGGSLG